MTLADDPDATLSVFRVDEESGTLVLLEGADVGVLRSSEMYVVLYVCKMGSLNLVYTWEGQQALLSSRTVAGLRVQSLKDDLSLKKDSAQHQIYVMQGAEPPLLVSMFSARSIPFVVCRGPSRKG